jgi:hypothetical protein
LVGNHHFDVAGYGSVPRGRVKPDGITNDLEIGALDRGSLR